MPIALLGIFLEVGVLEITCPEVISQGVDRFMFSLLLSINESDCNSPSLCIEKTDSEV